MNHFVAPSFTATGDIVLLNAVVADGGLREVFLEALVKAFKVASRVIVLEHLRDAPELRSKAGPDWFSGEELRVLLRDVGNLSGFVVSHTCKLGGTSYFRSLFTVLDKV